MEEEATDDGPARQSYSIPSKPAVQSSENESPSKVDKVEEEDAEDSDNADDVGQEEPFFGGVPAGSQKAKLQVE